MGLSRSESSANHRSLRSTGSGGSGRALLRLSLLFFTCVCTVFIFGLIRQGPTLPALPVGNAGNPVVPNDDLPAPPPWWEGHCPFEVTLTRIDLGDAQTSPLVRVEIRNVSAKDLSFSRFELAGVLHQVRYSNSSTDIFKRIESGPTIQPGVAHMVLIKAGGLLKESGALLPLRRKDALSAPTSVDWTLNCPMEFSDGTTYWRVMLVAEGTINEVQSK